MPATPCLTRVIFDTGKGIRSKSPDNRTANGQFDFPERPCDGRNNTELVHFRKMAGLFPGRPVREANGNFRASRVATINTESWSLLLRRIDQSRCDLLIA